MSTIIHFKDNKDKRALEVRDKITHEEAMQIILREGFKPNDNRMMVEWVE